jgi:exonuclease 3'-5' domain-containing protein 1
MSASTGWIIERPEGVDLSNRLRVVWVDTEAAISELVYTLDCYRRDYPAIFINIEGVNISHNGTISIMQIYDAVEHVAYLVDVLTLGEKCFTTPAKHDRTLKDILENNNIRKVFFDVRDDSHALYTHHDIALEGIHDIQLMELGTRRYCRAYVKDLSICIRRDAPISKADMLSWINIKGKGLELLAIELGGSLKVFGQRPLPQDTIQYCTQSVQLLSQLYAHYRSKLTPAWKERMISASKDRVRQSQSANFNGQGIYMAMAPDGWHEIERCPGALVKFH